jgi:hypothetical protein
VVAVRRVLVWLVVAVVLTAALVTVGVLVLGRDSSTPRRAAGPKPFETTPLSAYDAQGVALTRAPFCDRLDPRQVSAALGAQAASTRSWKAGDRVSLGKGAADEAQEFGCQYDGPDGAVARAWAFAPPVDATAAAKLVKSASKARGCAPVAPAFGEPGTGLSCSAADGSATASYRGLFGDTWVVCEVDRPAGATWDVADRAGRWCVGVLQGLSG